MAAASVLTPSSHYQPPPSFASSTYPPRSSAPPSSSTPTPSSSTMISSSEPRRASDENEAPARQSLPSISEVISGARPGQYPPPPAHQQPTSGGSLPSPFAAPSRQYPDSDKHSPQSMHPASFPSRQEGIPAFADSPRPPFSGRPGLPPVSDRRPTPPGKPDPHSPHIGHEPPRSVNGYPQPPPPSSHPYQQGQLPPGQMPLPGGYPISPREHYDARRPPAHEAEYAARARYEPAPNRHFETWSYQESFSRIGSHSRTIFNFAEAYGRIAQEQQGSQPIPERLPTEREVSEMLANAEYIKRSLEQVREVVQASIQSERAREGAKMKGPYEDGHAHPHAHAHPHGHDVPMYGDGMKPHYPVTEVKKRRGRAAPPGRCHSCNRIDTPEWRRGPDGARTLCNACGLHYAKLERKRQLEARALRPKTEERN